MKLLLLVAFTLPQVCYTWIDKYDAETLCQKATVTQISPHRFKVTPPKKRHGAVDCRFYITSRFTGTVKYNKDMCSGFTLYGTVQDGAWIFERKELK